MGVVSMFGKKNSKVPSTDREKVVSIANITLGSKASKQVRDMSDEEFAALDSKLKQAMEAFDKEIDEANEKFGAFMDFHTGDKLSNLAYPLALMRHAHAVSNKIFGVSSLEPVLLKMYAGELAHISTQIIKQEVGK